MKTASWYDVLTGPILGQHIAQTYQDEAFLVKSVSVFAGAGIQKGQGVLLVATKPHLKLFAETVEKIGCDVPAARSRGQLTEVCVEDALNDIMIAGIPSADKFSRLAKAAIQKTHGHEGVSGIRIFGELVNVLWMAGNMQAALSLETLWDKLGKTHPFTLFCGYKMDNFDKNAACGAFQSVCDSHSHLIPVEHYERLDDAVIKGSREVLGDSLSRLVRSLAADSRVAAAQMPVAQKVLLWLRQNMPGTADKVYLRTRMHYLRPSPVFA
jgi:hypothetical protein